MAATTKVKDVLWRVSSLLGDTAPQFNRWRETDLVNWLMDGELAVTKYLPSAVSKVISHKLRPGTLQSIEAISVLEHKLEDGASPSSTLFGVQVVSFINNMGATGLVPGAAIPPPVNRNVLDTISPNWHAVTGTKVHQVVYDPLLPKQYFVQPAVPETPAQWLRIGVTAHPTKIPNEGGRFAYEGGSDNTTLINLSDQYVEDLVNYVLARAYMANTEFGADPTKAAGFASLFMGSLNSTVAALTGTNPNLKRLPFAPEPIGAAS